MRPILEKFCDVLPRMVRLRPTLRADGPANDYSIEMRPVVVRLHRDLPSTTLWGFNGHYPGPLIEARTDRPIRVTWSNHLPGPHPIRPRLASAVAASIAKGPSEPIPIWTTIHLHGGLVPPDSDGMPVNAFFPQQSVTCTYPNRQRAATLWYHDNAFGQNRVNTYAGLFGAYILRDEDEEALGLPANEYELPLLLHDLDLNVAAGGKFTGELAYSLVENGTDFYGPFDAVNGKIWPYVEVEARQYRLRIINAAASRFYRLSLRKEDKNLSSLLTLIGTDGGLLDKPIAVPASGLVLAPGERADVIVDFRAFAGSRITFCNDASVPFCDSPAKSGAQAVAIMQFRIGTDTPQDTFELSESLGPRRRLDQKRVRCVRAFRLGASIPVDSVGPVATQSFFDRIDIKPELDSTEIWEIENPHLETGVLHVHLAQMQILDRYDSAKAAPESLHIAEQGWKDTIRLPPFRCTRVLVHFARYTGFYVYRYRCCGQADSDVPRPLLVVPQGSWPTIT